MVEINLKPDIKESKKAEIWGVVAIACADLVLIGLFVTHAAGLGSALIMVGVVVFIAQFLALWLCGYLVRLYAARLGIDDLHTASQNTNRAMELMNEQLRLVKEVQDRAREDLKGLLPCLKNLPPW